MLKLYAVLSFVLLSIALVVPAFGQTTAENWMYKGAALAVQGKLDEAVMAFDRAIEIDPQNTVAWCNKGVVFKMLGRTADADAAFAKAKELGYNV